MFSKLLSDIQSNTLTTLFRVNFKQQLPQQFLQLGEPMPTEALITNENQIEEILSGREKNAGPAEQNPVIIKTGHEESHGSKPLIGRNNPCHCGSGKKYKKCHSP